MNKLLTIYFSLLTLCATAQQQYTITNYTQEQGLQSGTIRGIYKDTTGYIWLTSEEGIARFDGYNFKVFRRNSNDSTSLPSNISFYGAFPRFGDIYFETQPRHSKFNPATQSFTFNLPFGDTLSRFRINEAKGNKNYYWAISTSAIYKITKTGTERIPLPFKVVPYDWKIIAAPDNRVLLSTIEVGKPKLMYVDEKTK